MITASTAAESTELVPRKTSDDVYEILLDGAWTTATSGPVFSNVDPASSSTVLGQVPECAAGDVTRAVNAAARDFDAWRLITGEFRSKVFFRLVQLLE